MSTAWLLLLACGSPAPAPSPARPPTPTSVTPTSTEPPPTTPSSTGATPTTATTATTTGTDPCAGGVAALVAGVPYASLQAAFDTSAAEVEVCPGQWTGPWVVATPVHLVGRAGAASTILVGDGVTRAPVLTVAGGTTLEGLTITGGNADYGGGVQRSSGGDLTVVDCVVTANSADYGGGIALRDRPNTLSLIRTAVTANAALYDGGGIHADAMALVSLDADTAVSANTAGGRGGGVQGLSLRISGGGLVADNTALVGGGLDASFAQVTDLTFRANHATVGGGANLTDSALVIGATFDANTADDGAGVSAVWWSGVYAYDGFLFLDGTWTDNVATTRGGALSAAAGPLLVIDGGLLARNQAPMGGGLWLDQIPLSAQAVDWSTGVDDNTPEDVWFRGAAVDRDGVSDLWCDLDCR